MAPSVTMKPPVSVIKKRLKKARDELKNLKTPNREAAILLDRWVQKNFKSEGKLAGGWLKLRAGGRWIGSKGNRRFDATAKVLQDTGRLRASFVPFFTNKTAGIGSDIEYSEKHEKGLEGLPVRRMLPNRKDIQKSILNTYEKYVNKITKKSIIK